MLVKVPLCPIQSKSPINGLQFFSTFLINKWLGTINASAAEAVNALASARYFNIAENCGVKVAKVLWIAFMVLLFMTLKIA